MESSSSKNFLSHAKVELKSRVIEEMNINGRQMSWSTSDYMSFYRNGLFPYQGISYCQFVFVPTVFNDHWWLYALNCQTRQLHVLDSIGDGIEGRYKIDKAMVDRLQHLFEILDDFSGKSAPKISLIKEKVPLQPNTMKFPNLQYAHWSPMSTLRRPKNRARGKSRGGVVAR
ncbi:hypothetical protein VNO80_15578 [Phaseolus coccineus]|uniref:Ubiquitin-like protease family profile domain-containing protein n=1 Tax=Phaseolus coccineus TaxID=3886 RepID=A0AAN9MKI5_PHACN